MNKIKQSHLGQLTNALFELTDTFDAHEFQFLPYGKQ